MRITFITGVSRGFGAALSKLLQTGGNDQLIGFSRNKGDFSGKFYSCDLTKPQLLESIVENAFSSIDFTGADEILFINNAGQLGPLDFIERLAGAEIQANLSANLISSSLFLSLFIKYTKDLPKSKLFVNISSGAALPERAKPGWALYCASKAAQEQLIRAVALEQQHVPYPAKTINFNPGVMDTNMQNLIRETPEQSFPGVDRFIELHRKGQLSDPSRVAQNLINAIAVPDTLETGKTYQHTDFET